MGGELFKGSPNLMRCDNMGANGDLIRGPNRTKRGRALSPIFGILFTLSDLEFR